MSTRQKSEFEKSLIEALKSDNEIKKISHAIVNITQSAENSSEKYGFKKVWKSNVAVFGRSDTCVKRLISGHLDEQSLVPKFYELNPFKHDILLAISISCGARGDALRIFVSYLTGRPQGVELGEKVSHAGEVLEVFLKAQSLVRFFLVYTIQFIKFIRCCKVHMYADDFQLYYDFTVRDSNDAALRMYDDLYRLADIAAKHSMKLNPKKSSELVFVSNKNKKLVEDK